MVCHKWVCALKAKQVQVIQNWEWFGMIFLVSVVHSGESVELPWTLPWTHRTSLWRLKFGLVWLKPLSSIITITNLSVLLPVFNMGKVKQMMGIDHTILWINSIQIPAILMWNPGIRVLMLKSICVCSTTEYRQHPVVKTYLFHSPPLLIFPLYAHLGWYPPENVYITMGKNHYVSWVNQLFLWPFSIAFCRFTTG